MKNNLNKKVSDWILWVAIWDAFWVPYEFKTRNEVKKLLSEDFVWTTEDSSKKWSWNQKPWTWSDDTSLTLCLADSLIEWYNLKNIAQKFVDWKFKREWTARWRVFDIWVRTDKSINSLYRILNMDISVEQKDKLLKDLANFYNVSDNWNWSLMRILPLVSVIKWKKLEEQFEITKQVSALTHWHIRSVSACFIYLKLVENILNWQEKNDAYENMKIEIDEFLREELYLLWEYGKFKRVINWDIRELKENDIKSSWYVIDSLEASLWSFLNTDNYIKSIMQATSLWDDTDTTSAITWWLSWLYYWEDTIPDKYKEGLARYDDIVSLWKKLDERYK